MKKIALFVAMTLLATSLFAIGVFAVDGAMADAVPATHGVLADFNPDAITEDLSSMIGDQAAVEITGSKGITSLALETPGSLKDSVGLALKEENGEKFIRFENKDNYVSKYSQLYFNLDPAVFTAAEELYFTITFRLNKGYTCTDGNSRAVLARLVDGVQNNCVIVNAGDLAAKDLTRWTTLTFTFTPANAPYVMRLIAFCNPSDYIDVKDFKVYGASVAPETEPVTEAVTTAAPTEAVPGDEVTPPTGDYTLMLLAASFLAIAAVAVIATKKVRN